MKIGDESINWEAGEYWCHLDLVGGREKTSGTEVRIAPLNLVLLHRSQPSNVSFQTESALQHVMKKENSILNMMVTNRQIPWENCRRVRLIIYAFEFSVNKDYYEKYV